MNVLRPSKNLQTGDPTSHGYIAWDFSHTGDQNVYASFDGTITQSVNNETRHWLAYTSTDPFKRKPGMPLLTADYGNFCTLAGPSGYVQLVAHMQPDSVLKAGSPVRRGDVIGKIGFTGNCTASHLHAEYRLYGTNIGVSFTTDYPTGGGDDVNRADVIREIYRGFGINDTPEDAWVKQKDAAGISFENLIKEIENGRKTGYFTDLHDGFADQVNISDWLKQKLGSGISFKQLVSEMLAGKVNQVNTKFQQIKDIVNK